MKFTKMQGCGNDYIYIDGAREQVPEADRPALTRRLSDRHFGIGGDGVIFIDPAPADIPDADFEMNMYNADGSRSEMCGNGIRCVGAYVLEKGLTAKKNLVIASAGARKYLTLEGDQSRVERVTVDMGEPILTPEKIPVQAEEGLPPKVVIHAMDRDWTASCVSMGNPHAVVFLPADIDLKTLPLPEIGPVFEHHPVFPNRVNTEFVRVDDRKQVHMRVWERGTGETLACGTGCCATTVACVLNGHTDEEITIHVLGGEIRCRYEKGGHVFMTGPAVTVYEGEIPY